MVLTAFYDESGTHGGSRFTILAGFVGDVNDWVDFEREWGKVLKKHSLSHIHGKHLMHRQGLFKGWSDKRVTELVADVLYVLQENKRIFASKTVLQEEDYALFYWSDGPAKRERLDSRYALCFRSFVNFYPEFHRLRFTHGKMNFVLEAGHRNAPDAVRVFNEMKEKSAWGDVMGTITFATKKEYAALQAADMLAYWSYRTEVMKLDYRDADLMSEMDWERFNIIHNRGAA